MHENTSRQETNKDDFPSFKDISARPMGADELSSVQLAHIKDILGQILAVYNHYGCIRRHPDQPLAWPESPGQEQAGSTPAKERPHQVITICGNRGTGKTSLILTLERILATRDPLREESQPRDPALHETISGYRNQFRELFEKLEAYRNLCLPIIFPADMESLNQATLEAIVSKLLDLLDDRLKALDTDSRIASVFPEDRAAYATPSKVETFRNELIRIRDLLFSEISTAWLFTRGDPIGMKTLANDSMSFRDFAQQRMAHVRKSFNRIELWRTFVDDLLALLGYDFLVIFLDDTDLTPHVSKDILETIRIYLNHPRIVTILAADYQHLRREIIRVHIAQHGWEQCRDVGMKHENVLNFVRREVDDYLYKVLPHSGRYDLTFYPDRDCQDIFNRILWRRYRSSWKLRNCIARLLSLPEREQEIRKLEEKLEQWLDENVILAAIDTPASRLLAFRKGNLWCWLGRSHREVTASTHKLLQQLEHWAEDCAGKSRKSAQQSREDGTGTDMDAASRKLDIDRQLLQILGARPAASRVSTLPSFSGYNFERLEMLFKLRRLELDEEMKYVISEKETALGVKHEIVYGDNGYFYLTFLLDTMLTHGYGLNEPWPNFPVCRLLGGIDKWVNDEDHKQERTHPEAEHFRQLRTEWKEKGLLRGIGNLHVISGLEAMPACMIYLADLAHLTAHGTGVSVNGHYRGRNLRKTYEERIKNILNNLDEKPQAALRHAIARVAARDDYVELMLRRINALICIDKERGDQLAHMANSVKEDAIYDPNRIQNDAVIVGLPVGNTQGRRQKHSLMVLKRCRVLLAWGLVAIFDQLLERHGANHENIRILLKWLEKIKNGDLNIEQQTIDDFILGDIPVNEIKKETERILNKTISDDMIAKTSPGNGNTEDENQIYETTKSLIMNKSPKTRTDTAYASLAEWTGWTQARWRTLIELSREHLTRATPLK